MPITMNPETLLQRKRRAVRISKDETLLILRAYREHPTNWSEVLQDIRGNLDHLPEQARDLYRTGSIRQLRDRMSVKLSKMMATGNNIADPLIRQEVDRVRRLETRHLLNTHHADQPVAGPSSEGANEVQDPAQSDQQQQIGAENQPSNADAAESGPSSPRRTTRHASPARRSTINNQGARRGLQPRRPANQPRDRRDEFAAGLSDSDSDPEPPRRRRRLADLIRENNELYNRFMTEVVPQILNNYGIDVDIN